VNNRRHRRISTIIRGLWIPLLIVGCAGNEVAGPELGVPNPTQALDPDRPCDIRPADGVRLSPREECWVERISARCGEGDPCLADCFANSKHRPRYESGFTDTTIGGGCWHLCFEPSGLEWRAPEGWEECAGLDWHLPG
jgi:hypothetical protein